MAESEQGIHPEVMRHIVDLHRKQSQLELKMHDKGGEEGGGEMLSTLQETNQLLRELIAAVKEDVKSDKAVANVGSGKRKQSGERGSAQPPEDQA